MTACGSKSGDTYSFKVEKQQLKNGKLTIREVAPNVHLLGVFTKKIFRKSFVFSVGEIRNYNLESETDRGEDPLAACGRMRGSHGES